MPVWKAQMTAVRLDNWSVGSDPYAAPELKRVWLHGVCTGHPHKPDGERVRTSNIKSADGRTVTTESGTVYRLGRVDPGYRKWLREKGLAYDPRAPVKVKA